MDEIDSITNDELIQFIEEHDSRQLFQDIYYRSPEEYLKEYSYKDNIQLEVLKDLTFLMDDVNFQEAHNEILNKR